jgi:ParB-like chromosome segregation protein Spo0J
MEIKRLRSDPKNARKHNRKNIEAIVKSLKAVGAARSIVIDENQVTLAGNGVLEAAKEAGFKSVRVIDAKGDELIAVRRTGLTKKQKTELALADNRSNELSEWDPAMLQLLGKTVDLKEFWSEEELTELLAETDSNQTIDEGPAAQIDKAAELQKKWKTERGQVWQIGKHRLMCGDSNLAEDAARLIRGTKPSSLFFDPPWDIEYAKPTAKWESILAFTDGRRCGQTIEMFGSPTWCCVWDCGACWYTPNRPLQSSKLCFWYGDLKKYDMNGAHYGDSGKAHKASNSRGSYWFVPDERGKHLSDIFKCSIVQLHNNGWHEHEKPVDWVRLLIGNCTQGIIFDPYAGSGTSFVASHQIGRTCIGMEINPLYAAVILERMNEMGVTSRKEKA